MKITDLIITANRNLLRNKLRTLLTVLAIFVGAFTLTLTNGLGDGMKDYIETQVKNYEGTNVLFINKKIPQPEGRAKNEPAEYKEQKSDEDEFDPNTIALTDEQIRRLAEEFPEVKEVSPNYQIRTEYITLDDGKKYQVQVNAIARGVTQKLEAGGQITGDSQIILQYDIAKALTTDFATLIGREVTVGFKAGNPQAMQTIKLKIVGVSTKGFMRTDFSTVDLATEKKIYELQQAGSPFFGKILTFSFEVAGDEAALERVKKRLDEKGFRAETMADKSKRTYDAISIFQIGMNLFAFIALLAASFGIINTLVIAVMERTKEIGLQKALGMGRAKIFFLFSLESILIGFWGAVAGIGGAILLGLAANSYATRFFNESFEGYNLIAFKPVSLLLIVAIISLIAFLAGVLPAFRASRLNPIEALRYE
jgi:putative ABC transport system permease protein